MTKQQFCDGFIGKIYTASASESWTEATIDNRVFRATGASIKDGKFYLLLKEIAMYVMVDGKRHLQKSDGPEIEVLGSKCFDHGEVVYGPCRGSL